MKQRAYISGFDQDVLSGFREFLDVRVWLHDVPGATHDVGLLTSLRLGQQGTDAAPFDQDCYQAVYSQHLSTFIDIFSRSFPYYESSYHGMLNGFNLLFSYCYTLLKSEQIECVIFSNIPHEAVDFVIEKIARYLKLPVLMCHQSQFPDRFWIMRELADFGRFDAIPELSGNDGYRLETNFNWFYMQGERFQYDWRKLLADVCKTPMSLPYALYKFRRSMAYRKVLADRTEVADLSRKYVYFPLHLQPELTTAALGGVYADQMLALERLSALVPTDWLIYVKENPKQTEMQRDPGFFQRMQRLPNVRLVPLQTNSVELVRSSQFVATITGTAGWEAISLGKKALVFGYAWYRFLPGVFRFDGDFSMEVLLAAEGPDPVALEHAVAHLLCKASQGVVDPAYGVLVKGYDQEINAGSVVATIRRLLA